MGNLPDWTAEAIRSITAPTLIVIGDADIVRPEDAVEMLRLRGGGVNGDTPEGLPKSRLAILPGTSHSMVVNRSDLLLPILSDFLTVCESTSGESGNNSPSERRGRSAR